MPHHDALYSRVCPYSNFEGLDCQSEEQTRQGTTQTCATWQGETDDILAFVWIIAYGSM